MPRLAAVSRRQFSTHPAALVTTGIRGRLAVTKLVMVLLAATLAVVSPVAAQSDSCWPSEPSMDDGFSQWSEPPRMIIDPDGSYVATIETNRGTIIVELLAEQSPVTVNNFVCLARAGYYDFTLFHRVIEGFMIQGGDPTGTGRGGPGYTFADELPTGDEPYTRGTIAMANAGPNTNGSQFFIVQQDQPEQFPAAYSIFGRVTEGMEVVDAIAAVPVGSSDRDEMSSPLATVGVKAITISVGERPTASGDPGPGSRSLAISRDRSSPMPGSASRNEARRVANRGAGCPD